MALKEGALSSEEVSHLKTLTPALLAGQSGRFWLLGNAVALACIAALALAGVIGEGVADLGDLLWPLGIAWLVLNAAYFGLRHVTRGLRGDMQAPRKQHIHGMADGVVALRNALIYTVDGQPWRAYPALPLGTGFVMGWMRITRAESVTGTAVTVQRTRQGERLLGVAYPDLDDTFSLRHEPGLSEGEQRELTRRAHHSGLFLALAIGATGLLLGAIRGPSIWLTLWLLPALTMYLIARVAEGPQQWAGWVRAHGPVTESLTAAWRERRIRRQGHWIRVSGRLFPVQRPPELGATVRLRARMRADGWAGETTELEVIRSAPATLPADAQSPP